MIELIQESITEDEFNARLKRMEVYSKDVRCTLPEEILQNTLNLEK